MIEYITLSYLWDFFVFGLWSNVAATVFLFFYTVYKSIGVSKEDIEEFKTFLEAKDAFIEANNSYSKRVAYNMLNLLPGYTVASAVVYLWYASTAKGLTGVIRGIAAMENFSFIGLIRFKLTQK